MTDSRWTTHVKRTAWGGALGLVVLAACASGSARAAEDDNDNSIWNLDQRLWSGVMQTFGLNSNTESSIEYRERSPLVVPPQRTLPPPETAAAKNPAWPVDPDAKRRDEAAAKRKLARTKGVDNIEAMGNNLTPSQLNPTGSTGSTASSGRTEPTNRDGMLPSQLGYFGGLFSGVGFGFGMGPKEEIGTFKAEPPRVSLTAPPAGYQTPSPAQPYGTTKRVEYEKPDKIYEDFGTKQSR
jgi:hypothetical protein